MQIFCLYAGILSTSRELNPLSRILNEPKKAGITRKKKVERKQDKIC